MFHCPIEGSHSCTFYTLKIKALLLEGSSRVMYICIHCLILLAKKIVVGEKTKQVNNFSDINVFNKTLNSWYKTWICSLGGSRTMRINLFWHIGRPSNIFQHNTCNICHSHDSQHEILHSFGIGSPTCLKLNIYVQITPQGSSSHVFKDSLLWGSLTKDYKVSTMVFTIISTFYFFKTSYSHMILL